MCGQGQCNGQGGCGKGSGGCHGQKTQKFMRGNPEFPIHFESDQLVVYTNSTGEVFVQSVDNGRSQIRIGVRGHLDELELTAATATFCASVSNGMAAIDVRTNSLVPKK